MDADPSLSAPKFYALRGPTSKIRERKGGCAGAWACIA